MQTILLTGNKGFIGSYIENFLRKQYHILGLSRKDGFDIKYYHTFEKIKTDIDIIIHTAAIATDDYVASFESNVLGTLNVCKYAKEKSIKHIIVLSSIFALDKEDNNYFNHYGQTKKMSEDVAETYCKDNDINLTILRLAQVYDDARLAQAGQAMLYYFIDTIRQKGEITLFGRSNPLRNYIHIDYFCHVLNEVLKENTQGIWNVIEEKNHTITEIAYMLFDILKQQPKITFLPDKNNIPSVHIPTTNIYKSDIITSLPLYEGLTRILNNDK